VRELSYECECVLEGDVEEEREVGGRKASLRAMFSFEASSHIGARTRIPADTRLYARKHGCLDMPVHACHTHIRIHVCTCTDVLWHAWMYSNTHTLCTLNAGFSFQRSYRAGARLELSGTGTGIATGLRGRVALLVYRA